ncbi:MAG: tetratricopeptide repeat protein [Candidatus Competibacteraceae bacterium]|nr:tetratricopeptide repeat protein [Candidatus Competibacteraceae bacterium]
MQPEAQAALRRVWLNQELARYRQRSAAQPDNFEAWRHIGRLYWELGEIEQAIEALEKALALQPDDRECLFGQIVACLALNRNEAALTASTRLLERFPNDAQVLLRQIEALRRLKRPQEALTACERARALPLSTEQCLEVLHHQASLEFQLGQWEKSLAFIDEGLALAPVNADWRLNRARLLNRLRRYEESLAELEPLIAVPAVEFAARCAKARALAMRWRFDEADAILNDLQAHYSHAALEREFEPWRLPDETLPDSLHKRYTGRGLYMMQTFEAQKDCDWTDWEAMTAHLDELLGDALRYGFVAGLEPHRLLSLPMDPAQHLAVARAQATAVDTLMAPARQKLAIHWAPRQGDERLRIGYVSGDFRDHATAHLIRKLFRVHDRARFEVFGYSLRPSDGSYYWQDISQTCDRFVELHGLSNAEAATRIAADGVHILVDLHGYTRFARPEIFALRPAPVQVAFLGYPGTLGADYVPYMIADRVVLPEESRPFFSEQPAYLNCYQINDDEQPIAEAGLTRVAAGLPEDGFVYCCFNNTYKIEPRIFGIWMRILRQTPGSVLWLLTNTSRTAAHLRSAADGQGVDPGRLIFAPRLPKAEHLERHRLADLFLDTFVVNAHTTASDALWVGLPVLTQPGSSFHSRVCASLLSALGLNELIVGSDQEYEERAVSLANNPDRLKKLQTQLMHCRATRLPFATGEFVHGLEHIYQELWFGWQEGG